MQKAWENVCTCHDVNFTFHFVSWKKKARCLHCFCHWKLHSLLSHEVMLASADYHQLSYLSFSTVLFLRIFFLPTTADGERRKYRREFKPLVRFSFNFTVFHTEILIHCYIHDEHYTAWHMFLFLLWNAENVCCEKSSGGSNYAVWCTAARCMYLQNAAAAAPSAELLLICWIFPTKIIIF